MANPFRNLRIFFGETIAELKKASWPSRNELRDSTIVVIVASILLGAFIALSDFAVYSWVALFTQLVR